jgi:hypothetical protein
MSASHPPVSCLRHIRQSHVCITPASLMSATHPPVSCVRHIPQSHIYDSPASLMSKTHPPVSCLRHTRQSVLTFMCVGRYSDYPGRSRADNARQEETCEQEVSQVVHTELRLKPVLCFALGTRQDPWKHIHCMPILVAYLANLMYLVVCWICSLQEYPSYRWSVRNKPQ